MFTPTNLKMLRKEEMVELLRSTVDICDQNDTNALHITNQVDALRSIVDQLDDALVYKREEEFTKKLKLLDRERDEAITGLRHGFLMNTYHSHPETKKAAQKLLDRVDSYGNRITRMNYESESAVLHNLVNDLETEPDLQLALQLVGLQDWVNRLKVANKKFRKLYSRRIAEESKQDKTSFTATRPEAITVYMNLINRINAYIELDETKRYQPLKNEINTLIERYKQIITNRKKNTTQK